MNKVKKNKGFTMIEMLIAVTIMGILSTMMIVQYGDYVTRTEQAAAEHEFMQIISIVDTAIATGNAYTDETKQTRINSYDDITSSLTFATIYESETGADIKSLLSFDSSFRVLTYVKNKYHVNYDFTKRMIVYDYVPNES